MDCDDNINNPLLYPDPLCSSLNMLADVASALHNHHSTSSTTSINIRFVMNSFKTVKECAYDDSVDAAISKKPIKLMATSSVSSSLKIKFIMKSSETVKKDATDHCSDDASNSKKPIKFMASSFAAYSSLKFHQHQNKTVTNNADQVFIKDSDLSSTSKNPFNFMGPATGDNDDENLLIKEKKRRALKGKSLAIINEAASDDVLDQDWKPSPHKSVGSSSSRKRPRYNIVVEAAPSELPEEFKDKIHELGGNEITLLITKSLYDSDLSGQQNRLSIPSRQIEDVSFLREGELEDLEEGKGIEVKLIQPSLEVTTLTLAKWNMRKKSGSISSSYVLRSSSWKKVIKDNDLKVNDRVQVWSFRIEEELCMVIVKV